ncbi:MAG TPA: ABC transporter substrate-binding protein [Candidatus Solibacter sp.]|nr:ABC transporter substrate-binding protein [Candidatus Solibacter sp.]
MLDMRRREFISLLGGAMAWPLAARGQQGERVRRIGVLMNLAADDAESQRRVTGFVQALQGLGWTDGRNVKIDYRWGAGEMELYRRYAAELLALAPDVILATSTPVVEVLRGLTRTVPIVFLQVADPVGAGFVESLAHPGGNVTGFSPVEYGFSAKWLELLREIAPPVKRVGVLRDPTNAAGIGQLAALQSVAPSFGVELRVVGMLDADEIERGVGAFARASNGGLIVTAIPLTAVHRALIVTLAAKHRLPAVYPFRFFAVSGGLISYGADSIEPYRRAAGYVDRIFKGEKPADLPVQAPTKYELVINMKTAKALGLTVPLALLARADEVIE